MFDYIFLAIKHGFKKMLRNTKVVETRRDFSLNRSCMQKEQGVARLPLKNSRPVHPQAGLKVGHIPPGITPRFQPHLGLGLGKETATVLCPSS